MNLKTKVLKPIKEQRAFLNRISKTNFRTTFMDFKWNLLNENKNNVYGF